MVRRSTVLFPGLLAALLLAATAGAVLYETWTLRQWIVDTPHPPAVQLATALRAQVALETATTRLQLIEHDEAALRDLGPKVVDRFPHPGPLLLPTHVHAELAELRGDFAHYVAEVRKLARFRREALGHVPVDSLSDDHAAKVAAQAERVRRFRLALYEQLRQLVERSEARVQQQLDRASYATRRQLLWVVIGCSVAGAMLLLGLSAVAIASALRTRALVRWCRSMARAGEAADIPRSLRRGGPAGAAARAISNLIDELAPGGPSQEAAETDDDFDRPDDLDDADDLDTPDDLDDEGDLDTPDDLDDEDDLDTPDDLGDSEPLEVPPQNVVAEVTLDAPEIPMPPADAGHAETMLGAALTDESGWVAPAAAEEQPGAEPLDDQAFVDPGDGLERPDDTPMVTRALVAGVPEDTDALVELLAELGVETEVTTSSQKALALFADTPFDVLFLGVQLDEDADGFDTTLDVRERETGYVPILGLTRSSDEEERKACLDAGMTDYLPVPTDAGALEATLDKWVKGRSSDSLDDDLGL